MALQCSLSIPNFYPTHLISEAIRAAQKDISLLKNMILTRFDCMDGAIIQLVASVSEVSSVREELQSVGISHFFMLMHSFNKKQPPLYVRLAKKMKSLMQKARKMKPLVASHQIAMIYLKGTYLQGTVAAQESNLITHKVSILVHQLRIMFTSDAKLSVSRADDFMVQMQESEDDSDIEAKIHQHQQSVK